jgi:hypothetical protein
MNSPIARRRVVQWKILPSRIARPFATEAPGFCAVCENPAVWLGYAPLDKWLKPLGPTIWLCTNPKCHEAAHDLYFADAIAEQEERECREAAWRAAEQADRKLWQA